MELIPILSLIVLVATISTFILAIGAYILYKIRERKGMVAHTPQPESIQAELIVPAQYIPEYQTRKSTSEKRITQEKVFETQPEIDAQRTTIFAQKGVKKSGPELKPTFDTAEHILRKTKQSSFKSTLESDKYGGRKKYLRYTKDGYIEPTKDDLDKEEILKWR